MYVIDPNNEGSYGMTPLTIAENYCNEDVIDFLHEDLEKEEEEENDE